jgi:hypothetical protein
MDPPLRVGGLHTLENASGQQVDRGNVQLVLGQVLLQRRTVHEVHDQAR